LRYEYGGIVPDGLFVEVERLVRESGRSRGELYGAALREYVAQHSPDRITNAIGQVVGEISESPDERAFVDRASHRVLTTTDW
jgi:hypothetical protein